MSSKGENYPQHHMRFYIVMATLVVAAILVLLFLNDQKGLGLTSAIVGMAGNDTFDTSDSTSPFDNVQDSFGKKVAKNGKEVAMEISFDQVPSLRQEAKIKDIQLKFSDLTTRIDVNNDKLALNNLQEVTMTIKEFSGKVDFDKVGFSLDGEAKAIEINNIALSSAGQIKISFDNLNYNYFDLEELKLSEFELPIGNGELKAAEKLTYNLEQDKVKLYFFNGKVIVDHNDDPLLKMEGIAKGAGISGALLDLSLS